MRKSIFFVLLALCVLGVTGCSGGDEETSTKAPPTDVQKNDQTQPMNPAN
jgi:hypothetical protein